LEKKKEKLLNLSAKLVKFDIKLKYFNEIFIELNKLSMLNSSNDKRVKFYKYFKQLIFKYKAIFKLINNLKIALEKNKPFFLGRIQKDYIFYTIFWLFYKLSHLNFISKYHLLIKILC